MIIWWITYLHKHFTHLQQSYVYNAFCWFSFFLTQYRRKRSYTRAYTHPYERTHAHPTSMSTSRKTKPPYHLEIYEVTSKMPVHCTEHQDAFVWVVYLVGEKDERGKDLFANVESVWVSFCKISIFPSYPSDINWTAYIAGWQAHHHHQLCFL